MLSNFVVQTITSKQTLQRQIAVTATKVELTSNMKMLNEKQLYKKKIIINLLKIMQIRIGIYYARIHRL